MVDHVHDDKRSSGLPKQPVLSDDFELDFGANPDPSKWSSQSEPDMALLKAIEDDLMGEHEKPKTKNQGTSRVEVAPNQPFQNAASASVKNKSDIPPITENQDKPMDNEDWVSEKTQVYFETEDLGKQVVLVDRSGYEHSIISFPFVLGRQSDCDLVLSTRGVSRRHAEILFQSGSFVIQDLDSLNGLKVNGVRVARVILSNDDEIKLGEDCLTFRVSDPNVAKSSESKPFMPLSVLVNSDTSEESTHGSARWVVRVSAGLVLGALVCVPIYIWVKSVIDKQSVESAAVVAEVVQKPVLIEPKQPKVEVSQIDVPSSPAATPFQAPVETAQLAVDQVEMAVAELPQAQESTKTWVMNADKLIAEAKARYAKGDDEAYLKELALLMQSPEANDALLAELEQIQTQILTLKNQYKLGDNAFAEFQKDKALGIWIDFVRQEKAWLGEQQSSIYQQSINSVVADEFIARAQLASSSGDNAKSAIYWKQAKIFNPNLALPKWVNDSSKK
jgi:pSer/pThr/pTyr-binding forkhead associated (FHA) protein